MNLTLTANIRFLHKHENFKAPLTAMNGAVLNSVEKTQRVILCVTENLTRELQSCKLQVQNVVKTPCSEISNNTVLY